MANNLITTTNISTNPSLNSGVTSLVNPDIIKNLKSSNLPQSFGDQLKNNSQQIITSVSNSKLAQLLKEKKELIEEEIRLDIEYQGQKVTPSLKFKTYFPDNSLPNGKKVKKGFVVTVPINQNVKNIALVWGGLSYATPSWMEKQIPNSLKENKIFIFADGNNTKDKISGKNQKEIDKISNEITLEEANIFINETFPGYIIDSVSGFSFGGLSVWRVVNDPKYTKVNLIDPTTRDYHVMDFSTFTNTIMVYNVNNWDPKGIGANLKNITKKINNPKLTISSTLSHINIPKWFFENYTNRL